MEQAPKTQYRIWKYKLEITDTQKIEIPLEFQILSINKQTVAGVEGLYMWVLVNPESELAEQTFHVFGTGHAIELVDLAFLASTVMSDQSVWHVFIDAGPRVLVLPVDFNSTETVEMSEVYKDDKKEAKPYVH